jgi:hypothetical protein
MDLDLASLERRRDELIDLGIWSGCFLESAQAGGTARSANVYWRVRAYKGETFEDGTRSKYVSSSNLAEARACVARGQEVRRLDKAIAKLTA